MPTVLCKNCKKKFHARQCDINRGWGKFCSKSCKAKQQNIERAEEKDEWRDRDGGFPPPNGFLDDDINY